MDGRLKYAAFCPEHSFTKSLTKNGESGIIIPSEYKRYIGDSDGKATLMRIGLLTICTRVVFYLVNSAG